MAVVQAGSIAKAAATLSISHPVVSKTISDLEHKLGVSLLERSSHGVEPTNYGRACLDCGVAVFDELRRGIQKIEFLSDPTIGEVRIGASEPMMQEFVPSIIERLARKHPRIVFHSIIGDAGLLHSKLRSRQVDLIISRRFFPLDDDLASEMFFLESLIVVCGRKNPWATRRKVDLAELINEPWIMPDSDNIIEPLITNGFRSIGLSRPKAQVVSNSLSVRAKMAANGHFLTILPGSTFYGRKERQSLKILPVLLPIEPQPVEIITLKHRMLSPLAALFIKSLRAEARRLVNSTSAIVRGSTGQR